MNYFHIFKWGLTTLALLLNFFVYFYPDIVNRNGQCQWAGTVAKSKYRAVELLTPRLAQYLLLNFPSLQEPPADLVYKDGVVSDIHMLTFGDPQINGNWRSTPYIKRLDNYGNDHYLGHIYRVMQNRLKPSHVAVMGDQFSSQWILDLEFYNRTYRFVERLFPRDPVYKQTVIDAWKNHKDYDWLSWFNSEVSMDPGARFDSRRYKDVYDWQYPETKKPNVDNPLFINLTGNHDVGYSGDATWQHMARFHYLFGQNNYVINYNEGTPEEWRIVVLDSLTLEGPALQEEFRNYTWSFLDHLKTSQVDFKGSTVLLTHIPFYKREGLCADGPEHRYYQNYTKEPYKNGKLRSQNHLLYETSQEVLDIVFPNPDKEGVILTGHDHVGCDSIYNHINGEWIASKAVSEKSDRKHIRELVVRAMMGEFGGQTGLLTGHFDPAQALWQFNFSYCSFVIQHVWWASKVVSLCALLAHSISFLKRGSA